MIQLAKERFWPRNRASSAASAAASRAGSSSVPSVSKRSHVPGRAAVAPPRVAGSLAHRRPRDHCFGEIVSRADAPQDILQCRFHIVRGDRGHASAARHSPISQSAALRSGDSLLVRLVSAPLRLAVGRSRERASREDDLRPATTLACRRGKPSPEMLEPGEDFAQFSDAGIDSACLDSAIAARRSGHRRVVRDRC